MFGLSWSEIGVILVIALIVIGPKDLPVAIRTVSAGMRKMRGLAAEFRGHVDELMREADLEDVTSEFRNLRNFDLGAAVEREVDPDGDLRHAFDPATPYGPLDESDGETEQREIAEAEAAIPIPEGTPAFIPPEAARQKPMPAFIPPGTRLYW
jgi:sec-independent protein translocase protein TatB